MTVVARKIIATPARSALETWEFIVNILTTNEDTLAAQELLAINGVACSLIADETMKTVPIVIYGSGPRVRIYCLYDEDAIAGDNAQEDALSFNATEGEWRMSLPCPASDLTWVKEALKKLSNRVTAREMTDHVETEKEENINTAKSIKVNEEAFLRP